MKVSNQYAAEVLQSRCACFDGDLNSCIAHYQPALCQAINITKPFLSQSRYELDLFLRITKMSQKDFEIIDLRHYVDLIKHKVVQDITENGARVIFVTGYTSTGKNAFSEILMHTLQNAGVQAVLKDGDDFNRRLPEISKVRLINESYLHYGLAQYDIKKIEYFLKHETRKKSNMVLILPIFNVAFAHIRNQSLLDRALIILINPTNLETKDAGRKIFRNLVFKYSPDRFISKLPHQIAEVLAIHRFDTDCCEARTPDVVIDQHSRQARLPKLSDYVKVSAKPKIILNNFFNLPDNADKPSLKKYAEDLRIMEIYNTWLLTRAK